MIRKMTRYDILFVEQLLCDTWPDNTRVKRTVLRELEDMFSSAEYRPTFFVAEDHGRIIGCGAWNWSWLNYGMFEICWGCVREDYRGRGLGRALVEARLADILQASRSEGETCHQVMVSTHLTEMYEHYGFRTVVAVRDASTLEAGSSIMILDR